MIKYATDKYIHENNVIVNINIAIYLYRFYLLITKISNIHMLSNLIYNTLL